MNRFQLTTQDYLAYLQMSNHLHVLVENDETKQLTDRLIRNYKRDAYVDDVDHLVDFDHSHTNLEQIGIIYSSSIRCPYAWKLVRIITVPPQALDLLPINDAEAITNRTREVLETAASAGVEIDTGSDVRGYLIKHNDLIDLLPLIVRVLSEEFNPGTQISLKLYRDPEIQDSYLAIFVRSEYYDEQFLDTIKSSRARYMDLLTGKSGWILITTDFDNPKESKRDALQLD